MGKYTKEFDVAIQATVRKTYRVEAGHEDEAIELAHQLFTVQVDEVDEHYDQDTISCQEVTDGNDGNDGN